MSKEAIYKSMFAIGLAVAALVCGALIYFGYKSYINPTQVYGSWIELNAPSYDTEIITLNEKGVFRNHYLVSTNFKFNGKRIEIKTGKGRAIYELAGTEKSPQLKRVQPVSPMQRFIKQGYEHTLDAKGGIELRRDAIKGHFENN